MPIESKEGRTTLVCDKCRISWTDGEKKTVDFKMWKTIGEIAVLCAPCAPEQVVAS